MKLYHALQAEILKYKNTWALYLSIGAPLFITSVMFLVFYFKGQEILQDTPEPWAIWSSYNINSGLSILYPLFLILITVLVNNTEHSNNSWKHIFALPVSKTTIYRSKYLFVLLLVFFSICIYTILILAYGNALAWFRPELNFVPFEYTLRILNLVAQGFAAALGILSIQFFVSWRWRSVVVPIGLGMAMFVFSMVLSRWEYIVYFPYAYPLFAAVKANFDDSVAISAQVWYGCGVFVFMYLVGLFDTKYRNIVD